MSYTPLLGSTQHSAFTDNFNPIPQDSQTFSPEEVSTEPTKSTTDQVIKNSSKIVFNLPLKSVVKKRKPSTGSPRNNIYIHPNCSKGTGSLAQNVVMDSLSNVSDFYDKLILERKHFKDLLHNLISQFGNSRTIRLAAYPAQQFYPLLKFDFRGAFISSQLRCPERSISLTGMIGKCNNEDFEQQLSSQGKDNGNQIQVSVNRNLNITNFAFQPFLLWEQNLQVSDGMYKDYLCMITDFNYECKNDLFKKFYHMIACKGFLVLRFNITAYYFSKPVDENDQDQFSQYEKEFNKTFAKLNCPEDHSKKLSKLFFYLSEAGFILDPNLVLNKISQSGSLLAEGNHYVFSVLKCLPGASFPKDQTITPPASPTCGFRASMDGIKKQLTTSLQNFIDTIDNQVIETKLAVFSSIAMQDLLGLKLDLDVQERKYLLDGLGFDNPPHAFGVISLFSINPCSTFNQKAFVNTAVESLPANFSEYKDSYHVLYKRKEQNEEAVSFAHCAFLIAPGGLFIYRESIPEPTYANTIFDLDPHINSILQSLNLSNFYCSVLYKILKDMQGAGFVITKEGINFFDRRFIFTFRKQEIKPLIVP